MPTDQQSPTSTCCVCKLKHQRLFYRYTDEEHQTHMKNQQQQQQQQAEPVTPQSTSSNSLFLASMAPVHSEKFINRAPEIVIRNSSSSKNSSPVVPEPSVATATATDIPPQTSAEDYREAYCKMCYTIKFREFPPESHSTRGEKEMWTWSTFREKGFSCPFSEREVADHKKKTIPDDHSQKDELQNFKPICLICTGGTIACEPDPETGLLSPKPLFKYLSTKIEAFMPSENNNPNHQKQQQQPNLVEEKDYLNFPATDKIPFVMLESENLMIDSTNATFDEWNLIAMLIASRMPHYSGFVILHGTDTLAYSASALTFSVFGLTCPIVITGSQLPLRGVWGNKMLKGSSDALMNLLGACDWVRQHPKLRGVFVYFHNKVFLGCRVVKQHSQNLDGFHAKDVGPLSYFNGSFTSNMSLLHYINKARDEEVRALAKHVQKFEGYFKRFLRLQEQLFTTTTESNNNQSQNMMNASNTSEHNNNNNDYCCSQSAQALDEKIRSDYPVLSPLASGCNPKTTTTPADIIPFFDRRHNNSIQRFHREAKVVVFNARPGAISGANPLQEQLIHHAVDSSEPVGILVLAYGSGNVSESVKNALQWARQHCNIPICWTSQCFAGGSDSHYAVGLSREEGVNVFDQTFESAYTRLLLLISQHIFIQCMNPKTREVDLSRFRRSREFRDVVEDWMGTSIRLCMTTASDGDKKKMDDECCGDDDESLRLEEFNVVRDSAVAMYV